MRTRWIAAIVALAAAGLVLAAPPAKFAEWAEGPAKFLMTKEEVRQWQDVQTAEQAEAFIALFWARRDPTPATPRNELQEEFDKRVALSDQHFTTKRTRGSMTDRGRALILLGSPWQVGNKAGARGAASNSTAVPRRSGSVTLTGPRGDSALLTWTYAQDKKPAFVKGKDFEVLFVDDAGDGQWQFAITPRSNPEAILEEAAKFLIVSPNLTKAPSFETAVAGSGGASLKSSAIKQAWEQFRADAKTSVGPALITWGQYITPEGEIFVPVQLFVPSGAGLEAGRKLTFFGVIENAAGQVVQVYEDPVTLNASLGDAYVDKSLSLEPGSYKAVLGLADAEQVVAMTKTDMTIEKLDAAEPAISQMILSNNAYALPQAQLLTDPFAFGGLKVVPKADAVFSQKDDIWYFFELRNPGLADSGLPKIEAKIEIEGKTDQDRPVKMALPWQPIDTLPLKGVKDHYGLGMSFPLKDFQPGRYKVKIKVVDTVLKKTYSSEREFQIKS